MLRQLHSVLINNRATRKMQRQLVGWVKDLVHCPDPYVALASAYHKAGAAAVLDVGSHTGYTVLKTLDFLPHARLHAFEPTPQTAQVLRNHVAGHSNVTVHELALSNTTGTATFFVNAGEMQNSLLDNASGDDVPFAAQQKHVGQVQVATMTMDDWAAKHEPTGKLIVKADVQGAEKLLVAGGRQTLTQRVAAFYTEVCLLPQYEGQATFWELDQLLTREMGFALFEIYPCGKDKIGRAAWTDAMWIKPDILPIEA